MEYVILYLKVLVSGAEQPAEPAAPKRRGRKPKAEQSDMTFNDESAA